MIVRVLGSGTSTGVPRVGNDWGACDPGEPRNRRRRASILVTAGDDSVLVDTSPDLREQLLDARVDRLSAVIWTHEHADHCHGINDLRPLLFGKRKQRLPGFARPRTLADLEQSFGFAFADRLGYSPFVDGRVLEDELTIGAIRIRVVDLPHGPISSIALHFDDGQRRFVYATDFTELPQGARDLIAGADLWIVDSLRRRPHPSHPHLAQVLRWHEELQPRSTVLVHLDQSMDYRTLCNELPGSVTPGYDGMTIDLT